MGAASLNFSKIKIIFLAGVLLLCACAGIAHARAAEERNSLEFGFLETLYDNANGLEASAANDLVQTEDGFIWIGTYNGLTRYDGSEFYQVPPSSGIYSVADLFVSSKGELFIGTNDSGVALYKEGRFFFWNREDGLSTNSVREIAENDEGLFFIGTTEGLNFFRPGEFITRESDPRLLRKYIKNVQRAPGNKICGLTKQGEFFVYDGRELESFFSADATPFGDLTAVEPDMERPDEYWVGTTEDKVAKIKIEGGRIRVLKLVTTAGRRTVNDLLLHPHGELLVAAENGVGYIDAQDIFRPAEKMRLNNSVDRIMLDYEKNLWFASSRMGIAKVTLNNFKDVFFEAGIPPRVVNSVLEYGGLTYVATDRGLFALRGKERVTTPLCEALRDVRIRHLLADRAGNLWIATYSGLGLVKYGADGTIRYFNRAHGLPHERTRVLLEGSDGSIYAGTRDGLAVLREDRVVAAYTTKNGLSNPQVLCLLEADGIIYIGTDGGGINFLRDGHIFYNLDEQDGLKSGVVLRMTRDPQQKGIWISTGNSIAYYEDGWLSTVKNFPSTNNFDIIFTPKGEMLVTCSQGIYVTGQDRLLQDGSFDYILSQREGLGGTPTANSFNYIDGAGNLYICLLNGLAKLDLDSLDAAADEKKFCVPEIEVDGARYPLREGEPFVIGADATRITYKAYVLTNALNNMTLSTWLEGFEEKLERSSRFANKEHTYTNLASGTYKLHVGIFDQRLGRLTQEKIYTLVKEKKLSEHPAFVLVPLVVLTVAACAAHRAWLRQRLRKLRKQHRETERLLDQVIRAFAKAIDLKDHYTRGHSVRVAKYSRVIAKAMGWSKERVANLYRVALLHDVGKVVIPDEILNKRGPLTAEEYARMKQHPDIGAAILAKITQFPMIAVGAKCHHERIDGKGYGHGLKGSEIPLEARIIAVADAFDTMNSTRVYRTRLAREKIISELENARGTQLDAKITDVLLQLIAEGKVEISSAEAENNKNAGAAADENAGAGEK